MKKTNNYTKILNRKNISFFHFLISLICLFFISCNKDKEKHFLYSNTNDSVFYQVLYLNNKIVLITNSSANNITQRDTSTFIKRKGQYFSNNKETTSNKESLIMSITKDTIYQYNNIGKLFFYKISKNGDNTFKAVSINKDSLRFMLKSTIHYDNNYNIFMIEELVNGKATQWKSL